MLREPVGYKLQPFEERLAELEIRGVQETSQLAFASTVDGAPTHQYYFDRFWKLASDTSAEDLLPRAAATSDGNRAAAHNYLTHGLHSYKGKYFPQIVRSLLNHAGVSPASSVIDPFVGSGTTTLESQLMGHRSRGIDRNPLAALIAETKAAALHLSEADVRLGLQQVTAKIKTSRTRTIVNRTYLERWFPGETLDLIARILGAVDATDAPAAFKNVARLTLSTNLRAWSLQEPSQLRIFRRPDAPPAGTLAAKFAKDLQTATLELVTSVRLLRELGLALYAPHIVCDDARDGETWGGELYDALITSPPYATALPYIDTDRLSIYALGLADVSDRNDLEWSMIGNREIRRQQRADLERALESNEAQLPPRICDSILRIKRANDRVGVGFRRANLPALLYKYFWDMHLVLQRASEQLRTRAVCAIVIGDSYTVAGGSRVRICTGSHLLSSAEAHGFALEERIEMGGQARYLPHQKNAIPAEEILLLRKT